MPQSPIGDFNPQICIQQSVWLKHDGTWQTMTWQVKQDMIAYWQAAGEQTITADQLTTCER